MVAMAMGLYKEHQNHRGGRNPLKDRIPKKACVGEKSINSGIDPWKIKKDGKNKMHHGTEFVWCPKHCHKDEFCRQSDMYMQAPHNHKELVKKK